MLSVILEFSESYDIENILLEAGWKKSGTMYSFITPDRRELATASLQHPFSLNLTCPKNLSMEEFKLIHDAILKITEKVNVTIDDSNSLLGYLQNGEAAYLITNWNPWISFLEKAKHRSMEGQKVRVINQGMEVGTGILLEYEVTEEPNEPFAVRYCTIITTEGEQSFKGQNLKIEPTGEW